MAEEGKPKRAEARMAAIESGIADIKEQLATIIKKQVKAENKSKEQAEKIDRIEKICEEYVKIKADLDVVKAENIVLKRKLGEIQNFCLKQKRAETKKSIEIFGIPSEGGENVKKIIFDLAREAKVEVKEEDVAECFRIKSKDNRDRQIILKLNSTDKRNDILKAMKNRKPTLRILQKQPENKKIFFNEALIPEAKRLLFLAKTEVKNRKWIKAWAYAGEIYILMENNGNRIKINDEEDLTNLIK